jgi:F-type H+-transporting ATPase subunit b
LSIHVTELIWAAICFLVLLVVLKKLLYDPIIRVMDERKANIRDGMEQGKQAKQARDDNDAAILRAKKETAAQAGQIVQQAKAEDEKARQEAVNAARQDAAQSLRDVRAQLREEEAAVSAQMDAEMPELVAMLTDALLKEAR